MSYGTSLTVQTVPFEVIVWLPDIKERDEDPPDIIEEASAPEKNQNNISYVHVLSCSE